MYDDNNQSGAANYNMAIIVPDQEEIKRKKYLTSEENPYRDKIIYGDIFDNIKKDTFKVKISKSFLFGNSTENFDEGYVDILRSLHEYSIEQNETCVVPLSIETLIKAHQSGVKFSIINVEDHFKIYYFLRKYIRVQSDNREKYKDIPKIDQHEEYNALVQHIDFSNRLYQELEKRCFDLAEGNEEIGNKYPDFAASILDRLMSLSEYPS